MLKVFGITKCLTRGRHCAALALALCLSVLNFFSCANDVDIDDFCVPAVFPSAEQVIFSGQLNVDGAIPKALTNVTQNEISGRAAIPSFLVSDSVKYCVSAKCTSISGTPDIEGSVDPDAKTYTIGLVIGRTYTVKAELKRINPATNAETTLLEAEWPDVKPTRDNSSLTHNFVLKPLTGADLKGDIALVMTVPSGITKVEITGTAWDNLSSKPDASVSGTTVTISGSDIPVGNYLVSINFYKVDPSGSQFLQYSIPQTINVFANMTTDTWQSGGSSSSPISGNTFVLTDTMIKNFQRTIFYVSKDKDFTGTALPADLTRTGSPYAPFAALQTAIDAIKTSSSAEDYKIYIDGNVIGSADIPSSITTSNAKSITISGYTGNDTVDVIIADNGKRVLTIATTVPLVIKNLKITGGNFSVGGGIYMDFGTKLTLDSGALVGDDEQSLATGSSGGYGNKASSYGGGIYNSGGTLLLKKGSKVCRNYCFNDVSEDTNTGGGGIASERGSITIEDGAMISYNKTGGHGGGIWLMGGTNDNVLTMNGGTISYNEAQFWGGGVHVGSVDGAQGSSCPVKLNFKGGEICYNKIFSSYITDNSDHYYTWGPNGAGVNVDHSYMEMSGSAKIHHNDSINTGGGVHVGSTGVFLMSGGEISENTCSREFDSDGVTPISGGGLDIEPNSNVVISGSAKIPYGVDGVKGYRKNDIWLRYASGETPSYITVGGALTSTFEMGIGVNGKHGLVIAQADGTNVTDLTPYKDYFNLIKDDWLLKLSPDNTKLVLDSPIYVSGAESHPYTGVAGSASGDGSKSAPFDSIANAVDAITALNNSTADYIIFIDGELTAGQIIPYTFKTDKAQSLTIKGVNGFDSDGKPVDVINANNNGAALEIEGNDDESKVVPVTIEKLKITGGLSGSGAGIAVGNCGKLTLSNDTVIEGNKSSLDGSFGYISGAGIYLDLTATLNIKGNVVVFNNTDSSEPPNPSNIYLQNGRLINVTGSLVNGTKKSKIGINTENEPTADIPVTITSGYGYTTGGYNEGVAPSTYFVQALNFGTEYAVFVTDASDEAFMGYNAGGSITIEPVYEDITISIDRNRVLRAAAEKKFTFTAKGTKNGVARTIPAADVDYSYEVIYHGETVTPASTYYTTDANTLTFLNTLPVGNYTISVTAVYNGKTYSAEFDVQITKDMLITAENINSLTLEDGKKYNFVMDSSITTDMLKTFLQQDRSIGKSTLDLSNMSGNISISASSYVNNKISSVTLNASTTLSSFNLGWARVFADVEEYIVPSNSTSLVSVDGVIYNKAKTELVLYPPQKTGTFAIPDTVTSIRNCAFQHVQYLSSITIPAKITNMGMDIFYESNLQTLMYYSSTKVSQEAFMNCANLRTVKLKGNVTEIAANAFYGCTSLETITLPASLSKINFRSFGNCPSTVIVNFRGTEEQKNAITNTDTTNSNNTFMNAHWNYDYTGD